MTKEEPGKRYNYYYKFNSGRKEYDWKHKGVASHIMSHAITESTNKILQYIIGVIDNSMIYIMSYIEKLKGFKNYNKTNR